MTLFTTLLFISIATSTPTIQEMITEKSLEAGIDPAKSLKIAECESRFDPRAKNKNSTAKGLYQFIDRTWNGYCKGDVYNAESNINCFIQLYPQHPSWWECKA